MGSLFDPGGATQPIPRQAPAPKPEPPPTDTSWLKVENIRHASRPRPVDLSWRSAWRVGVMVWLALCAFGVTAILACAIAAAILAASVTP